MARVIYMSAATSVVTAFPATIDDDGVDTSVSTLTVVDSRGNPVQGLAAARCVLAVSGTGNTVTQPTGVTDINGQITGSFVSTVAAAKTCSWTVCGLAVTDTASVTVEPVYVAPNILNNLSFEAGWDSYTDGGAGAPTAGPPATIARSTDRAFNGTTSVKFTWATNASDDGAAFFRSLGGSYDEVYVRLYFYVEPAWSITTVQKWTRFRTASTQVGGWYMSDSKGLAWGFDLEASAVTASIIPKASIPTGQWNYLECHYRRNGDAEPNAAFWLNGVPQFRADGADPSGFGLTWLDGRLYAGARNNSTQINMIQHVGTLNAGNTGSGTIYLDYIAASSAGRIGP